MQSLTLASGVVFQQSPYSTSLGMNMTQSMFPVPQMRDPLCSVSPMVQVLSDVFLKVSGEGRRLKKKKKIGF
jgi:hypothetical protein